MGLLRHRDARLLILAYALSSLGDFLALTALTIRVHDTTASGYAVSGLLLAELLPLVVLAPVAGQLVDRVDTVRLLAAVSVAQAILAACLAFVISLPAILALSVLLGACLAVTNPALLTLLPHIVGLDQATRGNAYLQVAQIVGGGLGTLSAGALAATHGTRLALLVDAATFLVMAGAASALRVRRSPAPQQPSDQERGWQQARAGLVFLATDRLLRLVTATMAGLVLFATIDNVATVFYAKDVLDAGDLGFGLLLTVWPAGMLLGVGAIVRWGTPPRLAVAILLAAMASGSTMVTAAAWPTLPLALLAFFLGGCANGVENVAMRSLVHHRTPEPLWGRAFTAFSGLASIAQLSATAVGGVLVAALGARLALLLGGASALLVGIVGLLAYLRLSAPAKRIAASDRTNEP
jgi:MFS family permease